MKGSFFMSIDFCRSWDIVGLGGSMGPKSSFPAAIDSLFHDLGMIGLKVVHEYSACDVSTVGSQIRDHSNDRETWSNFMKGC